MTNTAVTQGTLHSRIIAYGAFDFANSSISLIIHAYLFPLYFKNVLFHGAARGDAAWGALFSLSVVVAAIAAPFVGRLVDHRHRFASFAIISAASFVSVFILAAAIGQGTVIIAAAFVLLNVTFYLASNVYDSLLAVLGDAWERVRISSAAWGIGYAGGILCFVGVYALQVRSGIASRAPYLFTACFYTAFGAVALVLLRRVVTGFVRAQKIGLKEMLQTLSPRRRRQLFGYWLLSDTINAVIFFTAIYASTQLSLSATAIGGLLLAVQIIAFPGTYAVGRVAERYGVMRTLTGCVGVWLIVLLLLVFGRSIATLVILCVLTGFVIGSTQALMRAHYSFAIVDRRRTSEVFGWYAIATESAAIAAPLLFGAISVGLGNQRIAMAALAVPLIAGLALLRTNEATAVS